MKRIAIIVLITLFVFSCSSDSNTGAPNGNSTGKGGSLARFAIVNNYLYTVDQNKLNVFQIQNPSNPVLVNTVQVGFDIETLFSLKNYLFIGSQNGMFIYSIQQPENPIKLSQAQHLTSCDPVVSDYNFAYVTLHSDGNSCGTNVNQLEVYDIADVQNPILKATKGLIKPKGLGLYNNYLFICDDEIKIFDKSDVNNIYLAGSIGISAFDVIIDNDHLIAIGDNLVKQYQLNPSDINDIDLLSTISF